MLARVAVLEDDVERGQVVYNEAVRSVRVRIGRVPPQAQLGEHRGHKRGVVRDEVEHGVVRAVVHRVERDFELDRAVRGRQRDGLDGHKREVVDVVVRIDRASAGEGRRGGVRDG